MLSRSHTKGTNNDAWLLFGVRKFEANFWGLENPDGECYILLLLEALSLN